MGSFESFSEWDKHILETLREETLHEELKVLHVNIRSLQKNWDHLCAYLQTMPDLDVIALSEINITAERLSLYCLRGYSQYAVCRENRKGGGVLVFVKDSWLSYSIDVKFDNAELLNLSISKVDTTYTLCIIYRPPNLNTHKYIEELQLLLNKYMNDKHLILVGDINIDIFQESQRTVTDYLNLLAEHGLYNAINDYTREEFLGSKISKSCIDHIVLRLTNQRYTSGVVKYKLAGHYFVMLAVVF